MAGEAYGFRPVPHDHGARGALVIVRAIVQSRRHPAAFASIGPPVLEHARHQARSPFDPGWALSEATRCKAAMARNWAAK